MKFSEIIALDEADRQHRSAIARQVYGMEYALDAAWLLFRGALDASSFLYFESDDFGF